MMIRLYPILSSTNSAALYLSPRPFLGIKAHKHDSSCERLNGIREMVIDQLLALRLSDAGLWQPLDLMAPEL